jgi:polysaccharide chain length determinant protein (PEP-CTERM system associated)
MQVQDTFSVPRRALDVEDYIDVARRHKGWIFGPVFTALVASVVVAFLWPDTYVSSATIKVNPQQVPEMYVQSNVNQLMSDRIASIAQTVLSRPVLTSIITTYGLYPRDQQKKPMEDIVESMRTDIKISNVMSVTSQQNRVPAFQIAFAYTDRKKARDVVNDLVGKFIDTNLRERSTASNSTTELLKNQWDQAKKELEQAEDKLAQFRQRNQGRLPDEMSSNIQQMSALQTRLANINAGLSRINQEKLTMETQLRIYKDQLATATKEAAPVDLASQQSRSERVMEVDREIRQLEANLMNLRENYKETHPDVQRVGAMLAAAKRKRETVLKDDEASRPQSPIRVTNPQAVRESRDLEAAVRRLQSFLEAKDLEAEDYRRELNSANAAIRSYQARMDGIPMSERDYSELHREREMSKQKLQELDVKVNRAMLAQDMENRKQGESLEPLDPPSLPQTPTEPKRAVIIGVGSGLGLLVGLVFAGAREVKDTSLKNLKDVRAYTQLPILGSVPLLENDLVVKRRRRFAWFAWSLACLTGVAVMSGSIIYYYATKV